MALLHPRGSFPTKRWAFMAFQSLLWRAADVLTHVDGMDYPLEWKLTFQPRSARVYVNFTG